MNLMKLSRTGAKDVKSYGFDSNDDTVHDASRSHSVLNDAYRMIFFFLIVRGIIRCAMHKFYPSSV